MTAATQAPAPGKRRGGDDPGARARAGANRSPLVRKIIAFNLLAILVLVAGVIYLDPFRNGLVQQRKASLATEAALVSKLFEAGIAGAAQPDLSLLEAARILEPLALGPRATARLYDGAGRVLAEIHGPEGPRREGEADARRTPAIDAMDAFWSQVSRLWRRGGRAAADTALEDLVARSFADGPQTEAGLSLGRDRVLAAATPIRSGGQVLGGVVLTAHMGEIDRLVRADLEMVLRLVVLAMAVSVGLSLVLAATISAPLSDLAEAAEIGRDRNNRRASPGRVSIPDLGTRPDEIGRLASALRGMVAALYDRIDANEQFAADVAHEIKNPLASLRSAVGSLRMVSKPEHRDRLLDVIEHDVRRLDRLVSDISNASRLDSELVKEEEVSFDLLHMLRGLGDHFTREAEEKGVELITDLPEAPMTIEGLESRLAQVFVNLLSNAISFCEEGDAIRIWARRRHNRVLVVVEDTGPGIPEAGLTKVFDRFYSERPDWQFGNNSGLGLAISKQIVEAHGGVIWAENIEPTDFDPTSDRLGARFVVGLPV